MEYIKKELSVFNLSDFNPNRAWADAARLFSWWAVPACVFVVFVSEVNKYRSVEYYEKAIFQGIGPILWNVIGTFGLAFFCLSIIFSRLQWLSAAAHQILTSVYAIGALSFGLIFGQFICLVPQLSEHMETWQVYVFSPAIVILLFAVAGLNVAVWYMSYLIKWENPFREKLSKVSIVIRLPIGCVFLLLSLWSLWIEK